MFDGWVWYEGSFYTATLATTLNELRSDRTLIVKGLDRYKPEHLNMPEEWDVFQLCIQRVAKDQETDLDLLHIAYQIDFLYWTEWHDEPKEDWHEPPNPK